MVELLKFLKAAVKAYRLAGPNGIGYCAVTKFGVPEVTCLVAMGRESWRLSQLAIQAYEVRKPEEGAVDVSPR